MILEFLSQRIRCKRASCRVIKNGFEKSLLLVSIFALSACSDDNFPKYTALSDLRILALVTSAPEVSPGDSVTITPYISDLNGGGRGLTYSVSVCSDPGVNYGATPNCDGKVDRIAVVTDQVVSLLTSPDYTGPIETFSFTVPTNLLENRSSVEKMNGIIYLIDFRIKSVDGAEVDSYKRVFVSDSTKMIKNQSPTVSGLKVGETSLAALPTEKVSIVPDVGTGAETYSRIESDGSIKNVEEILQVTWFYSDGTMEFLRTEGLSANEYTPPTSRPTTHNVILTAVVRDKRGGEAVTILKL